MCVPSCAEETLPGSGMEYVDARKIVGNDNNNHTTITSSTNVNKQAGENINEEKYTANNEENEGSHGSDSHLTKGYGLTVTILHGLVGRRTLEGHNDKDNDTRGMAQNTYEPPITTKKNKNKMHQDTSGLVTFAIILAISTEITRRTTPGKT